MVAANVLRNDMPLSHWHEDGARLLLDVREPAEVEAFAIPGAQHIPLKQLRARIAEVARDRPVDVVCRSGQRAYLATRILRQNGIDARTLSGGVLALQQTGRPRAA
jgi:rhodanese-related sulfurtransferase